MIRGIIKAVLVGWITKKIAERGARRSQSAQPAGYGGRRD